MLDLTKILAPVVKDIPLFRELTTDQLHKVLANVQLDIIKHGKVVFHEGEEGDAMYIIKEGSVLIYHEDTGQKVKTLGDGNLFGEMALLSGEPRNASAKTLERTGVFIIKKEDFGKVLSQNPDLAKRISQKFVKRSKQNQSPEPPM